MYLTRLELNPARRGTRHLLGSPQAMHSAVEHVLPSPSRDADSRLLWRVDRSPRAVMLYVQSEERPDLSHIVEQAGWPATASWQTANLEPLLNSLESGRRFGFRLTANPVRSGRPPGGGKTKKFGHVTAAQQADWLLSRADGLGFSIPAGPDNIPSVIVRERETLEFAKAQGVNRNRVTIRRCAFEGELEVTDPDALRTAMRAGIGRAKAYGCGLLTLAGAREV